MKVKGGLVNKYIIWRKVYLTVCNDYKLLKRAMPVAVLRENFWGNSEKELLINVICI